MPLNNTKSMEVCEHQELCPLACNANVTLQSGLMKGNEFALVAFQLSEWTYSIRLFWQNINDSSCELRMCSYTARHLTCVNVFCP